MIPDAIKPDEKPATVNGHAHLLKVAREDLVQARLCLQHARESHWGDLIRAYELWERNAVEAVAIAEAL